ncbi:MAG: DUF3320 domain-containing protein [Euryarchaeota archaeon]|nr:DUF3320 domain-containing protein [Euryarchaeota archaeon]
MVDSRRTTIQKQFEVLRKNLLDLSMRNQLLNFRPTTRSIEIINSGPGDIYHSLVLAENKLQFLPKKDTDRGESKTSKIGKVIKARITEKKKSILWDMPEHEIIQKERRDHLFLETDLARNELQRRLFYINQQANSVFEEQGYNVLYMALGFLKWREKSKDNKKHLAPLILVPVELERKRVKGSFKIMWTGEDIIYNISLQEKLLDQGIELPDFKISSKEEAISDYLNLVKKSVTSMKQWKVIEDIYLSFFSFTKFVMYKDLEPGSWPKGFSFSDNPVIEALFDPAEEKKIETFSENDVDKKLISKNLYHVLDADSSQIAVIEEVKAGKSILVEGPPGTGKSQTIVNLIAELMAAGKTILFVSEKMAALEVVKSRLDRIGLGEFCLELHSRKTNKKQVLRELENTLYAPRSSLLSLEDEFRELESLKSELNNYPESIHNPVGEINLSPYDLYGIKEESLNHFKNRGRAMPRVKFDDPARYDYIDWKAALTSLNDISQMLKFIKPIKNHPWRYCSPKPLLPVDEDKIRDLITNSIDMLEDITLEIYDMVQISGFLEPYNKSELDKLLLAFEVLKDNESVELDFILNPDWNSKRGIAYNIIKDLEIFRRHSKIMHSKFKNEIFDEDLSLLIKQFKNESAKLLKSIRGGYKKSREKIARYYKKNLPQHDDEIIQDLLELKKYQEVTKKIKASDKIGGEIFSYYWRSEKSDPRELKKFLKWMNSFRRVITEGLITEKSLKLREQGFLDDLELSLGRINLKLDEILGAMNELDSYLKIDYKSMFGVELNHVNFEDLLMQLEKFQLELSKLQQWSQFVHTIDERPTDMVDPIIKLLYEDALDLNDIIPCFEGNFADELLKTVFLRDETLSGFMGDLHENKIKKFMELDNKLIKLNGRRLTKRLVKNRPSLQANISPHSELGILLSEFTRKRRHMPIRKLLSRTGGLIKKIKPCFMMSPLSIAQYIDPQNVNKLYFDVIIFDEASQVKPEDALGAFLRGRQLVVMGDTRQLPPTTFFELMMDSIDEEDYELSALTDMESILHLCKRSFPTKMLRWHYRSRHESLIAVSNQEFYENKLLVYPSPCHESDELGLQLVHLPDSVYDRGKTSTNQEEAREVVKSAFEHFKKYGNRKSLGIGTFNIKQQQAILEELELQLKLNPKMEKYFRANKDEHFFIKNLETIQGDERDVIMVSVGYGFDADGKLSLNFGPLNKEGGERRLNVLVTRARERCVVFSNFKAGDMKVRPTSAFGLRALKVFLGYAENRDVLKTTDLEEILTSAIENSIYDFLRSQGFDVHQKVGCAGFRVDLAVVDPENPDRYVLGIICDGEMYISSYVARDRDKLRQQVLKGLGWHIHHIWSTEWYRNRIQTEENLIKAIENAQKLAKIQIQSPEIVGANEEEIAAYISVDETSKESKEPIPTYKVCISLRIDNKVNIYDTPLDIIAEAIMKVAEIEAPIHTEELTHRIGELWGFRRTTTKLKETVYKGLELAEGSYDKLQLKNEFIYHADKDIAVRRRGGEVPARIEHISEEEIAEALKLFLNEASATKQSELIKQTSRLLGFKVTRGSTARRMGEVLNKLIDSGELIKANNGLVDFNIDK